MKSDRPIYEGEFDEQLDDPNQIPVRDRKVITQPYDISILALTQQIKESTLHLRPISDRPKFQRRYIWPNKLASRLVESILFNVPIPPCYFSQNEDLELDVIDGQQRIYSLYRFLDNQFKLSHLEVFDELNGKPFFELTPKLQRKLTTHTLRCVIVTNDSHPEVKFDVFERLNTNTIPLNAQELRNCIYRGSLNSLLTVLSEHRPWLNIFGRKTPDKRLRDEELILRFFAFHIHGFDSYKTPQKHWLNEAANQGRKYSDNYIEELSDLWQSTISKCLQIFEPKSCFRRVSPDSKSNVINRAMMDLTMRTVSNIPENKIKEKSALFRRLYKKILKDDEFQDLVNKSVDHKSRTLRRLEIWIEKLESHVL